jgi:rubrerythrin
VIRTPRRTLDNVTENADDDVGGDPACWAHLVCPECGRFAEGDSVAKGVCAICGAALPSDDD